MDCNGVFELARNFCHRGFEIMALHQDENYWPFIYGVLFPILVLFTIVANIFVVLVLSKKHMVSPTNVVLLYMAIADLFVGIVPFPFTFYYYTLGNYQAEREREFKVCVMYQFLMDSLPPICHNIAMWLTVLLAAQRFIYIQYPLSARSLCTVPRVKWMSFAIVSVSIVCGVPKCFEHDFVVVNGDVLYTDRNGITINRTVHSCLNRASNLLLRTGVDNFYNAYFWTRVVVFITIPAVLLILLNVLLIRGIHAAKIRKERLLAQNRRREALRQNESSRTSLVLVLIVSVFLIVNLPPGFFLALVCVDNTFGLELFKKARHFGVIFLPLVNMLILATYPLNFAIYCWLSSQFRETFKRLFCRQLPPLPYAFGSRLLSQISRRSLNFSLRRPNGEPRKAKDLSFTIGDDMNSSYHKSSADVGVCVQQRSNASEGCGVGVHKHAEVVQLISSPPSCIRHLDNERVTDL